MEATSGGHGTLFAGTTAPQTPSGRSKATACYTATPRSPRTPRRRVARPSTAATVKRNQSYQAEATAAGALPAQRGPDADSVQAAAAIECSPRDGRHDTPVARIQRQVGDGIQLVWGIELTPVRPRSVRVGGALLRTPPTVKARAHTAAVAGELKRASGRPVVPERSREKLNEAFKRTSALLQRCKGTSDDRDHILNAPVTSTSSCLSSGITAAGPRMK